MTNLRQVLTFPTRAWSRFAPPTCRMPLGQYQHIHRAEPGGSQPPFWASSYEFRHFTDGSLPSPLDRACRDHRPDAREQFAWSLSRTIPRRQRQVQFSVHPPMLRNACSAVTSWLMTEGVHGASSILSGTRTSCTPSATPNCRRIGSRTSGLTERSMSWRGCRMI
jgi:hypothetical protein